MLVIAFLVIAQFAWASFPLYATEMVTVDWAKPHINYCNQTVQISNSKFGLFSFDRSKLTCWTRLHQERAKLVIKLEAANVNPDYRFIAYLIENPESFSACNANTQNVRLSGTASTGAASNEYLIFEYPRIPPQGLPIVFAVDLSNHDHSAIYNVVEARLLVSEQATYPYSCNDSTICNIQNQQCCNHTGDDRCYTQQSHSCAESTLNHVRFLCPPGFQVCKSITDYQCYSDKAHVCIDDVNCRYQTLCPINRPLLCGADFCYNAEQHSCVNGNLVPK